MNNLKLINLTKRYGSLKANDDISFELDNGVYGLLGPNGAGKSTLMKQIVLLTRSTSGEIHYNNKKIKVNDTQYLRYIGYLPQSFGVYKSFTAKEFLLYMASLKGLNKTEAKRRTEELLKTVNLQDVKNKKVSSFSGGMKQRVGIAQALLNNPKILILDEPTAGLDPKERAKFRTIISELSKDKIVVFSTHIISDIESIAKETIMIKDGRVLIKGTHDEILAQLTGKVYEITTDTESLVEELSKRYTVINIQRGIGNVVVRIIADTPPNIVSAKAVLPRFEDVYMFYFDEKEAV